MAKTKTKKGTPRHTSNGAVAARNAAAKATGAKATVAAAAPAEPATLPTELMVPAQDAYKIARNEQDRLQADLGEELYPFAARLLALNMAASKHALTSRYNMGLILKEVLSKYKTKKLKHLIAAIGFEEDTARHCLRFALRYSSAEAKKAIAAGLGWSSIRALVNIDDNTKRSQLQATAISENLTYAELVVRVQKALGKRGTGGRKHTLPATSLACATKFRSTTDKWLNMEHDLADQMMKKIEATAAGDVSSALLDELETLAEKLDEVKTAAGENGSRVAEAIESVKAALEANEAAAADAEETLAEQPAAKPVTAKPVAAKNGKTAAQRAAAKAAGRQPATV